MCRHAGTALRVLIRLGLRAGLALLVIDTGTGAGADVRTACGGVDTTDGGQRTVDVHLHIDKVFFCAVIMLSGGILHRFELASGNKVLGDPLVTVIDVDALAVCNRQASALGNIDLNARQQCRILIDGHIAGLDIDGDVVGDGQYIACRVNAHACKL